MKKEASKKKKKWVLKWREKNRSIFNFLPRRYVQGLISSGWKDDTWNSKQRSWAVLSFHLFCLRGHYLPFARLSAPALLLSFTLSNPSHHLSPCLLKGLQLLSRSALAVIFSHLSSHSSLCHISLSPGFLPNLFFLAFNLLHNNYLSSTTDGQTLVLQVKVEICQAKSLCAAGIIQKRLSTRA